MARSSLKQFCKVASENIEPAVIISEEEDFAQPAAPLEEREKKAWGIVKRNMAWSSGLSFIPVPFFDLTGIAAFQAIAIKELSDLYEIPFSEHRVKNCVACLISSISSLYLASVFVRVAVFAIPIIGPLTYISAVPLMSAAVTYATGKVFIQHFEAGGTFLDFEPKKVRTYFRKQFEEGMVVSVEMRKDPLGED
jgi:uncharacterized protein (DUF697 family)